MTGRASLHNTVTQLVHQKKREFRKPFFTRLSIWKFNQRLGEKCGPRNTSTYFVSRQRATSAKVLSSKNKSLISMGIIVARDFIRTSI